MRRFPHRDRRSGTFGLCLVVGGTAQFVSVVGEFADHRQHLSVCFCCRSRSWVVVSVDGLL